MKHYTTLFSCAVLALFLNSCASGYQGINPKILTYNSKNASNEVILEYKYDLLQKKYKKKERRHDVRLVALKLTNLSEKDLVFGQDLKITYENGNAITLLERSQIYSETRQIAAVYFLYLALTPFEFTVTTRNSNGPSSSDSFPFGLFAGPGLAARNVIVAHTSNKRYKKELKEHYLLGKTLKKGETTYGLIGIVSSNYDAIKFKTE